MSCLERCPQFRGVLIERSSKYILMYSTNQVLIYTTNTLCSHIIQHGHTVFTYTVPVVVLLTH